MILKGEIMYGGIIENYSGENLNHNEEIIVIKIKKEFPFNVEEITKEKINNECLISISNIKMK